MQGRPLSRQRLQRLQQLLRVPILRLQRRQRHHQRTPLAVERKQMLPLVEYSHLSGHLSGLPKVVPANLNSVVKASVLNMMIISIACRLKLRQQPF